MIVGIDFDNTIVCYDGLFYEAAVEREMIPVDTPPTKEAVRGFLRAAGREDVWTELQGLVYGHEIRRAKPFAGAAAFLARCLDERVTVNVISHRTRQPFIGPAIDMHQAAHDWLDAQHWFTDTTHGLDHERVFLEATRSDKLARIAAVGCDVFIDDLPDLLAEPEFPSGVERVLFDPHATGQSEPNFKRAGSWQELTDLLFSRDNS
ncbi:MAG: hypothetical protein QGH33_14435 [Pirellulaceae bacterium]|jgi:hypothetical protein|nr:hypothetical protein [Pirellulaceae bacterium]MDP7303501.1 hypothetical protein [Pirellulaceae bacterium]HJN10024.1 hypothetical protein [Pirellulaceae bacterium]